MSRQDRIRNLSLDVMETAILEGLPPPTLAKVTDVKKIFGNQCRVVEHRPSDAPTPQQQKISVMNSNDTKLRSIPFFNLSKDDQKKALAAGAVRNNELSETAFAVAYGATPAKVEDELIAVAYCRMDADKNVDVTEQVDRENQEPAHFTDLGNSQRFRQLHAHNVRHSTQVGWLCWDGTRFRRDDTQHLERLARDVIKSIYQEAAGSDDKDWRQTLVEWGRKCESAQKIGAMLNLAESEPGIAVRANIFDQDPWLLNVSNGTVDLRTAKLQPHNRDDLITKITPIDYDPMATCPTWCSFLERIFDANADLIRYCQNVAGYCLTADTREQEFYIFYGLGSNGKTTFVKTLLRVLGEYALQSPIETFLVKTNGGIPNDVARLAGARFVAAIESEANKRLAESLVKALTGGDRISARFLHREFFEFEPTFKLILSTNHRPRIIGTDHAIWRRVRLVPFEVTIPKKEQDRQLAAKLEGELPGILRWCIEGCLSWQRDGLEPPEAVVEASESYRDEMDTLGDFLDARCVIEAGATVTAGDLYAAYTGWSDDIKNQLSKIALGHALTERGFQAGRRSTTRLWRGLKLKA